MELMQIGADALKVTLTREDMIYYAIEFERLDYENTETRRAIWDILDEAKRQIGFEAARDKLYIQVFKGSEGGCELFVRRAQSRETAAKTPLLFRFDGLSDLLAACARLENCRYAGDSTAYAGDGGGFYLLLRPADDEKRCEFLTELGRKLPFSPGYLGEHARPICDRAVHALAALR